MARKKGPANLLKSLLARVLRSAFDVGARSVRRDAKDLRAEIIATHALSPLNSTFVPWTMPAMSPRAILTILNDIVINERDVVVELGGGVSTFYVGRLLRERGSGRLITVDHDPRWADMLLRRLGQERLDEHVTVLVAPLRPVAEGERCWYAKSAINAGLRGVKVDMLLVDGPPRTLGVRGEAVPFFREFFSDAFSIVVDDARRPEEQGFLRDWEDDLGFRFKLVGEIAYGFAGRGAVPYI